MKMLVVIAMLASEMEVGFEVQWENEKSFKFFLAKYTKHLRNSNATA